MCSTKVVGGPLEQIGATGGTVGHFWSVRGHPLDRPDPARRQDAYRALTKLAGHKLQGKSHHDNLNFDLNSL